TGITHLHGNTPCLFIQLFSMPSDTAFHGYFICSSSFFVIHLIAFITTRNKRAITPEISAIKIKKSIKM
ncbi:TPA: hypothetical protein ACP7R6_004746, partial [Escherichia coli]